MSAPQYRMLEAGEHLQIGDEVRLTSGVWEVLTHARNGEPQFKGYAYRRPTSSAPAAGHTPKLHYQAATDRVCGTESWGECFELISAPAGDPSSVDALFVGFVLTEKDAAHIVTCVNQHEALSAENAALRVALSAVLTQDKGDLSDAAFRRYICDVIVAPSLKGDAK